MYSTVGQSQGEAYPTAHLLDLAFRRRRGKTTGRGGPKVQGEERVVWVRWFAPTVNLADLESRRKDNSGHIWGGRNV